MRIEHIAVAASAIAIVACGGYSERYPSYEAIVAQYLPPGPYAGTPLDASNAPDCAYPECPCPRLWYDAHWVYYCDGRWVYWLDDGWYWYPVFYVSYMDGVAYVIDGPVRHITDHPVESGQEDDGGSSQWRPGFRSDVSSPRGTGGVESSPARASSPDRSSGDSGARSHHPRR
jgi:hypothetical protein